MQYTLAISTEFALNRSVHPELAIALDLSPQRAFAWVVNTGGHDFSLLGRVNAFFVLARREGMVAALLDRYYGKDDRFDYLFSRNFMEHVDSRLPRYVSWFQEAAQQYGLDWRLLAAMGYQESKWDPARRFVHRRARAHADDRGHGRHDARRRPSRSAREYFRGREVPGETDEADAAANSRTRSHLVCRRGLQRRTRSPGGRTHPRPGAWHESRSLGGRPGIPAAAEPGALVYATKRGYARGWEPVRYVENVQAYLNILQVAGTSSVPAMRRPSPRLSQRPSRH